MTTSGPDEEVELHEPIGSSRCFAIDEWNLKVLNSSWWWVAAAMIRRVR